MTLSIGPTRERAKGEGKSQLVDQLFGLKPEDDNKPSREIQAAICGMFADGIAQSEESKLSLMSIFEPPIDLNYFEEERAFARSRPFDNVRKRVIEDKNYSYLLELLLAAHPVHFQGRKLSISRLKLYLLSKACEAKKRGFNNEQHIQTLSDFVTLGMWSENKAKREALEAFTDLDIRLDIETAIGLWSRKLTLLKKSNRNLGSSVVRKIQDAIDQLANNGFKEEGSTRSEGAPRFISTSFKLPSLKQLGGSFTDLDSTSAYTPEDDQPRSAQSKKFRAELNRAKRISLHALTVDEHHVHFWPAAAEQVFNNWLTDLKSDSSFTNNFVAFVLDISLHTGLSIVEVLQMPLTGSGIFVYEDWHVGVQNKQLALRRKRPKRVSGVSLPKSIADYCAPLGNHIEVYLKGFKNDFVESLLPLEIDQVLSIQDRAFEISSIESQKLVSVEGICSFTSESLRNLALGEFFTESSIRYQAFSRLTRHLGCPAMGELTLARPRLSTSAITGYLSLLQNGLNVCGSEISFTDDGMRKFSKLISDRFFSSLNAVLDREHSWIDLINLASKRIWLLELMTTGRRPIATGIECLDEFDDSMTYAYLLDKFVAGQEEGRVIYIPSTLRVELKKYLNMLDTLQHHFSLIDEAFRALLDSRRGLLVCLLEVDGLDQADRQQVTVKEISPDSIFQDFAEEISDVRNAFRHFWIQKVFGESKCIELTKAFAGHSDGVYKIYGDTSNRCRKDDLIKIGEIQESLIELLQVDSDRFWNRFNLGLEQCLAKTESHPEMSVLWPPLYGRAARMSARQQRFKKTYKNVRQKMEAYTLEFKKLTNETSPEYKAGLDHFLQTLTQSERNLDNKVWNRLFRKFNWPHTAPDRRIEQFFPTHSLMRYIKHRAEILKILSSRLREPSDSNQTTKYTRHFCMIVELIYKYNFLDKRDLKRLFEEGWTRVISTEKNEVYLEIARRYKFNDNDNRQSFRIRLPHYMADLHVDTFNRRFLVADLEDEITEPLRLKLDSTALDVLLAMQTEALEISCFEQPAFVAANLSNERCLATSTDWGSILFLAENNRTKTTDYQEIVARNRSTKFSSTRDSGFNNAAEVKQAIISAINENDLKLAKSKLKTIADSLKASRVQLEKSVGVGTELASKPRSTAKNGSKAKNSLARRKTPESNSEPEVKATEQALPSLSVYLYIANWARFSINKNYSRKLQASTVKRYLTAIFEFAEFVGPDFLEDLDDEEVDVLRETYAVSISKQNDIEVRAAAVNSFTTYLADHVNEAFSASWLTAGNRLDKSVSANWIHEDQFTNLVYSISNSSDKFRDELVVILSLMFRFGCRINEAKFLLFSDVYCIGDSLLGIVIRANKHRRIKGNKSAKRLFISQLDPLNDYERKSWQALIAERKIHTKTHGKDCMLFTTEAISARVLGDTLTRMRQELKNEKLTFHSLRHSFANRRGMHGIDVPMDILRRNFINRDALKPSSRALNFVKSGLRHSSMETSWTNYIHIFDRYVEFRTRGLRRGSKLQNVVGAKVMETCKLPGPECRTRKTKKLSGSEDVTKVFKEYYFFRQLIEHGKVHLSEAEFNLLTFLMGEEVKPHPSFNGFGIISSEPRHLFFNLTKPHRGIKIYAKDYRKLLRDLKKIEPVLDVEIIKQVSKLAYVFSASNEILISNPEDFRWLALLSLGPKFIRLEAPPVRGRLSCETVKYDTVFGTDSKTIARYEIKQSIERVGSEVSEYRIQKGIARVRLRYRRFDHSNFDLLFFVSALILFIKRAAKDPNMQIFEERER